MTRSPLTMDTNPRFLFKGDMNCANDTMDKRARAAEKAKKKAGVSSEQAGTAGGESNREATSASPASPQMLIRQRQKSEEKKRAPATQKRSLL
jgi:hypothetical protein